MIQYDGVWCVQFLAVCSSGYNIVRIISIIQSFAFYHREMRNLGRLEARRLKKKEGGKGWKRPDINNKTAIK